MHRSIPTPKRVRFEEWPCIHLHAAGLDIGAAVPPERDAGPVRVFETFTLALHALVDWLVTCDIETVAMESTGVSWGPIFELLEQRGLTPSLVNARHVKTVPGRKTDGHDAQWLQKLQALGLLQASFRPDAEMYVLGSGGASGGVEGLFQTGSGHGLSPLVSPRAPGTNLINGHPAPLSLRPHAAHCLGVSIPQPAPPAPCRGTAAQRHNHPHKGSAIFSIQWSDT
jgi:hypothetical protein